MQHTKKNILELTRTTPQQWLRADKLPLRVLLDDIRSLNNVGSILRTADAFMVDSVIMCGITGTPPHPEIHKTALGAEDSVRWVHSPCCRDAVTALKADGWHIIALEQTHNSVMLDDFTPLKGQKYAIICGNEVHGVDQTVIDLADTVIEIPQCGAKHSLNVAVSTGILLWTLFAALK